MTQLSTPVSIQVGDGMDEPPIDVLIWDLARDVHRQAVEHWGRTTGCGYRAFTGETADGREAFATFMREVACPEPDVERHLAEWDEAARPVAIVHWFPGEPVQ